MPVRLRWHRRESPQEPQLTEVSTRAARHQDPRPTIAGAATVPPWEPRQDDSQARWRASRARMALVRQTARPVAPPVPREAAPPAAGARQSCAQGRRRAPALQRAPPQAEARAARVSRQGPPEARRPSAQAQARAPVQALVQAAQAAPAGQAAAAALARAASREVTRSVGRRATASAYPNYGQSRGFPESPWTPSARSCRPQGDAS